MTQDKTEAETLDECFDNNSCSNCPLCLECLIRSKTYGTEAKEYVETGMILKYHREPHPIAHSEDL